MTTPTAAPGFDAVQAALDSGDISGARRALLSLSDREIELLREEVGDEAVDRSFTAASRSVRGTRLGKVIVLPGIMGSMLDTVDRSGGVDRIWVHYLRLIGGHMGDLRLTVPGGDPANSGSAVRPAGLLKKPYLPLLLELDTQWNTRPFAFDWREDIDKSAVRLDAEVRAFGAGEPVHLVAHSMGGLVGRYLALTFSQTWKSMADGDQLRTGGRLVMLGTPNRGSFAPSLALTGDDKLVRRLELVDTRHNMEKLLAILSTFPGLYQMLPSPKVDLGDDHLELYDPASWPTPVYRDLLARAHKFQSDLQGVIDPQRLIYVAGHNRATPARITIDAQKKFRYATTLNGDGRVPHSLGLLDGVATYYVEEDHGDLPKNGQVLDAIHDLLLTGETRALPSTGPRSVEVMRGAKAAPTDPAGDLEVRAIVTRARSRGVPQLTPEEEVRLHNLITEDYLGSGGSDRAVASEGTVRVDAADGDSESADPSEALELDIVWGDVTKFEAQLYSVGHYKGVLPQRAEWSLDQAISTKDDPDGGIIASHTRRGALPGAIGDVSYFPWATPEAQRVVAVAGMGDPGVFDERSLRRLVRGLALAVAKLPGVETWCTVLIGSGEGTLSPEDAARSWLRGLADAAVEMAVTGHGHLPKVVVTELFRDRTTQIRDAFDEASKDPEVKGRLAVHTPNRPRAGRGRRVSMLDAENLLIDSLTDAADPAAQAELGAALEVIVGRLPIPADLRSAVVQHLRDRRKQSHAPSPSSHADAVATRISFSRIAGLVHVAAINETATVPERIIKVNPDDLVRRMTDPPQKQVQMLCEMLHRLLIPIDFRSVLDGAGPFVFDVDRDMTKVHWEMCADPVAAGKPLALCAPVARQLRTTYSPAPLRTSSPGTKLRALVIGDPGDPAKGHDLPGARSEAVAVVNLLRSDAIKVEIEVEARIGAPSAARGSELAGIAAADRLEVLYLLATRRYDLVHYAGHGAFDEVQPERAGWVFADGLISSDELQNFDEVPALIVANACLSGLVSRRAVGGADINPTEDAALLAPTLADEFFKLGVRNYIGTAWEVNDIGAETFARVLYTSLLSGTGPGTDGRIGDALLAARLALWKQSNMFGPLWAAYQHYGDPNARVGMRSA